MKKSKKDPRVLLAVLLVLALGGSFAYTHEGSDGILHSVQSVVFGVSAPLAKAGGAVDSLVNEAESAVDDATATQEELSALIAENQALRQRVAELEEYRQEAERLQELLNLTGRYGIEGVTCRVIGRSTEAYNQTITVDAGSNDGVDCGQTVMGPNGVVGQVISVTATTSTIRLISDPQSGVAVMLQSNRREGVVTGSLEGVLYLEDVATNVNVQLGDVVVTSGLGGSYTRGLIVGTVVRIDQNQGESSRRIVVSPNEDAGPLQEVTIVAKVGSEGAAA